MNIDQLAKSDRIKSVVKHLAQKFGEDSFMIKDRWRFDFNAIGLSDLGDKFLIRIVTHQDNVFFGSLEDTKPVGEVPWESGDIDNLDLPGLEKIFAEHLRFKPEPLRPPANGDPRPNF